MPFADRAVLLAGAVVLGLVALAANDRPGHDSPPKRVYWRERKAASRAPLVGCEVSTWGLSRKTVVVEEIFDLFFDAFLTAC